MKLKCTSCGTPIEFTREMTTSPEARVECPQCHARFRIKPRRTVPPDPPPTRTRPPATLTPTTPLPSAPTTPLPRADRTTPIAERPTALSGTGPGEAPAGAVFADGEVIANRYRIVRFIAQGGMGQVFEAEDLELHERVALKTISAQQGATETTIERFKREIHLARKVTHPNVCRIFDLGQHHPQAPGGPLTGGSVTFLTMELLQGETLVARLRRRGRLSTDEALPLARQIAAGLGAAHQAQVVHRDLKSENVFLVPAGDGIRAVVTDFGIARGDAEEDRFASLVTGAGIVGTPAYMAPEQIEGAPVTAAADVYAFGVVLYEMVTGRLPFEGDNPLTTAVRRLKEPPPPPHVHVPDLDVRWERTILRCLERKPEARFATIDEAAEALTAKPERAQPPSVDAVPAPVPEAPRARPARQRRLLLEVGLLLVLAVVAVVYHLNRGDEELDRSRIVPRRSVAVLGFKNQRGSPEVAWMSTALAEMLSTELTRGEALRTIPGERVAWMKQELTVDEVDALAAEDLQQVRSLLGCDFVVRGSFLQIGSGEGERIRLDARLEDAALGRTLGQLAAEGTSAELFDLVEGLGAQVRDKLGAGDAGEEARSGMPRNREAAKLYAEALDGLRQSQPLAARDLLREAARLEPDNPLIHSALSTAWEALGYGARAAEEAERAFELSSQLPREDHLVVEARFREVQRQWPAAIESYRTLWQYFPDNLEYGLGLAAVETSARRPQAALITIAQLRELPPPSSEDPRIDLAEAAAAGAAADYPRQLAAARQGAERAARVGALLLVAQARISESQAQLYLGRPEPAATAADQALAILADVDHPAGEALALIALANAHFERADFDQAILRYHQATEVYRRIGNQGGTASTLNNLAVAHKRKGELDRAQELFEQAETIYKETGDRFGMANTVNNLASLLVNRDQLAAAKRMFERSLALWQEAGLRANVAFAENNIAAVLRLRGELAASRDLQRQALAVRREIGHKAGEVVSLSNLGGVLCDLGELAEAERNLTAAGQLAEEIGNRSALALALFERAEIHRAKGDRGAALELHERALELRRQLAESYAITDSEIAVARVRLEMGDAVAAETTARRAAAACHQDRRLPEEARAGAILALALLGQDRRAEAREAIAAAKLFAAGSEQRLARFEVVRAEARIAAADRQVETALASLRELAGEAQEAGYLGFYLETLLAAAEIELAEGRWSAARDDLITLQGQAAPRGYEGLSRRAEEALEQIP